MPRDDEMGDTLPLTDKGVLKAYASIRRKDIFYVILFFAVGIPGMFLMVWSGNIFWGALWVVWCGVCNLLLWRNSKCPRCRSSLYRYLGGANLFCSGCRARVSDGTFLCPECGDMVNQWWFGMKYCPKCGVRLR